MRLRPYRASDYEYIGGWITERRAHALWSADRLPYPLTKQSFHDTLAANAAEKGECGFVYAEDDGTPVGFCSFSIDDGDNSGFVRMIVVDGAQRGRGIGVSMLRALLRYAFELAGVSVVRLNVFDSNPAAKRCYEKVGFREQSVTPAAYDYYGQSWARILMAAFREEQ